VDVDGRITIAYVAERVRPIESGAFLDGIVARLSAG
jgi:hypothetical protein